MKKAPEALKATSTRAPGAGRPLGRRSALPSNMCASIARWLCERYADTNQRTAIHTAIATMVKMSAGGPQQADFAYLQSETGYGTVRKALWRMHQSQQWLEVELGVLIEAAAQLSRTSTGAAEGKAIIWENDMQIASHVALDHAYTTFLQTNPTKDERLRWLAAHEARISNRKPLS